jgi:hypothetical protein
MYISPRQDNSSEVRDSTHVESKPGSTNHNSAIADNDHATCNSAPADSNKDSQSFKPKYTKLGGDTCVTPGYQDAVPTAIGPLAIALLE